MVAAAPVLATDTSDVGHVVANREILDLPLNGRSYLQLAGLTNGVVTFGSAGGDTAGPRFTSQGTRHNGNSYLVDGVDTRTQRNSTYGLSLSVDAIGEFKIMQNAFSAEFGRGTTIVNSTVKTGHACPEVLVSRVPSAKLRCWSSSVTLAPGTTAPELSVTVPRMSPVFDWHRALSVITRRLMPLRSSL